jgi:hypothetical protein
VGEREGERGRERERESQGNFRKASFTIYGDNWLDDSKPMMAQGAD